MNKQEIYKRIDDNLQKARSVLDGAKKENPQTEAGYVADLDYFIEEAKAGCNDIQFILKKGNEK